MVDSQYVRQLLKLKKITQKDLAAKLGVDQTAISSRLSNSTVDSLSFLVAVSELSDVPLLDLIYQKIELQKIPEVKKKTTVTLQDMQSQIETLFAEIKKMKE
jgi:transcriptional regulator with XRE-family HTH domain